MIFIRCADNEIEYIRNKAPHIIKGIHGELVGNQSFLSGGQVSSESGSSCLGPLSPDAGVWSSCDELDLSSFGLFPITMRKY